MGDLNPAEVSIRPAGDDDISNGAVKFVRGAWFIRGILSIYSIACVLYITASVAPELDLPPLRGELFPW